MQREKIFLCSLLAILSLVAPGGAQEAGRQAIALDLADKTFSVRPAQDIKMEPVEGGGLRATYANPKQGSWLVFEKTFDQPVKVTTMGFEMKVAESEKPFLAVFFANGKVSNITLDTLGEAMSPYQLDLSTLTDRDKNPIEGPVKKVSIAVPMITDSGEKVVDLQNWWVEP